MEVPITLRLLVLGGTGPLGRHVIRRGADRGYAVTALVRDPSRLPPELSPTQVVTGNACDPASVSAAMRGQNAVVSALGVGRALAPNGLIATAAPVLVRAMQACGVRRLVFTSAFGVGETWRDTPLVPKLFTRTLLRRIYADKAAGEAVIRASDLDWTIVYPTGLTDRRATGQYRSGEHLRLRGFPNISRADVADFLVAQVEDRTYLRRGALVST